MNANDYTTVLSGLKVRNCGKRVDPGKGALVKIPNGGGRCRSLKEKVRKLGMEEAIMK